MSMIWFKADSTEMCQIPDTSGPSRIPARRNVATSGILSFCDKKTEKVPAASMMAKDSRSRLAISKLIVDSTHCLLGIFPITNKILCRRERHFVYPTYTYFKFHSFGANESGIEVDYIGGIVFPIGLFDKMQRVNDRPERMRNHLSHIDRVFTKIIYRDQDRLSSTRRYRA